MDRTWSTRKISENHPWGYAALIFLGVLVFSGLFGWINYLNYHWLSPIFERSSTHTVWGFIQRLFLILPGVALVVWRPRQIGFQMGSIRSNLPVLAIMLAANVGVMAGYMLLSGGTPYSSFDLLVNEVITVPLVEEVMWRGIVFAVLAALLRRRFSEGQSAALAAVFSGVCFGLLHAGNALFGYPLAFVALQTFNATVWGILYGFARAKTGSVYPPIGMHAAMNLVVVLL
jgi:membrane protease YdiL (CAAX protease family)